MNEFIILNLTAPLLSFGGVAVDNINPTMKFPAKSMITGLLSNALGYNHESEEIERLQKRIIYGTLNKKPGIEIQDYQTVNLGQDFMVGTGWTTWGNPSGRDGQNDKGTHIRKRFYIADSEYLVALTLKDSHLSPTLNRIENALLKPERPLFLGRKCCLPSDRIFQKRLPAQSIEEAFINFLQNNQQEGEDLNTEYTIWLPCDQVSLNASERVLSVSDERDWKNQIHSGCRLILNKKIHTRK
jgi:CRISPR system Cascade subunit CasD